MKNTKTIWEKYYLHSVVFCVLSFLLYTFWWYSSYFYSAILDYKTISSDVFDGTVYPIAYVPNPLDLSYTERRKKFDEIDSKYFIKTPVYNPTIFGKNLDDLKPWSREYNDAITQKIVYTVPYLSTYNFDYQEYSGSHPGVDIVVPEGTPVLNIANGLVVDIGEQSSWFGKYILIKHSDVPVFWKKQTIYSLYAHLSKTQVRLGSKIKKWEIIGLVWETGTATVPHLHFQIDVESAPYSPFWPFTTADMRQAGVWFFQAVNIGLWKELALEHTINPFRFVNEHLHSVLFTGNNDAHREETLQEVIITPPEIIPEQIIETKEILTQKDEDIIVKQELEFDSESLISQVVKKEDMLRYEVELLSALDANDVLLKDYTSLKSLEESILPKIQETSDFSQVMSETSTLPTIDVNEEIIQEILEDEVNKSLLFQDISWNYEFYEELMYFKEKNIISGFQDNTFRPKNNITRAEALKIMLLANNISPVINESSKFQDIKTSSWENTYINAGVEKEIISLDNKNFFPYRNVSRVEALKIIFTLWWVVIDMGDDMLLLDDVSSEDWYYQYVYYAVKNNLIVLSENKFEPNKTLTREELIRILYLYIQK